MRILIEKATNKILEMQSDATPGTLIKNAVNAGYKENEVEEKLVDQPRYEEAKAKCPVYIQMAKDERKAKLEKEQADKKAKEDVAEVIDEKKIDDMKDIKEIKDYLKKLVKVVNMKTLVVLFALLIALPSWGADVKFSELPTVTDTTPASDVIPMVASGATSKITVANFLKNYQPLLTYPVTGLASPAAGYLVKWGVAGNTLDDGLKFSTMTDGQWCKYTTADGLICNSDEPEGGAGGDIATDTIWAAAGDLVYGTGNDTASALGIGTAYQLLMTNSGASAPAWTSTLGATGTRLTYGYFTDLAVTNAIAGSVTGNAATATALAANPTDCGTGTLANAIDASGNLTCTATPALGTAGSVVGSLSFANATSGSIKLQPITGALGTTVVNLGVTYTDTKYCTYSSTTGLTCNAEGGTTTTTVANDTIWDAAGDLVQGAGANTATKLTKGAAGTILRAGSSYAAWTTATFADTYTKGSVLYAGVANTITGLAHPGAANRLFYTTGTDGVGWLTSSADVVTLLGAANYAGVKTQLGYYTSGDASTFSGVTITKSSGVPGRSLYYEANSTDTNGVGWEGPASRSGDLYLKFPNADPTDNQVLVCDTPAAGVSTCTWEDLGSASGDFMADGSVPMTGDLTMTQATPDIVLNDSTNAAGTGSINANSSGGANDVILTIGVEDSTGASTPYIEVDGVTETVDFLKPITVADVTNDNFLRITNNASRAATASVNELYPEANVWKFNENGTEYSRVAAPTAGPITMSGSSAARTWTIPDAAVTIPANPIGGTLGATANVIPKASGTGTATLQASGITEDGTNTSFGALNLITTGAIHGGIEIIGDDTSLEASQCYGSFNDTNGAETITLPTAVVGMNLVIYSNDATVKTIDPYSSEVIELNGVALTGGYAIKSPGAAGNFVALICRTTGVWTTLGMGGAWVTNGS